MKAMAEKPSGLDDPGYAKSAWARYRRTMRWMALAALAAVAAALAWLQFEEGGLTLHLAIATTIAVGLTIMVAAALMGLVFLSSGTGHDEDVDRFGRDEGD